MIGSSGFTISPNEVEEVVVDHPAVNAVAVIGVPDEVRGEIVKAFVVLKSEVEPSTDLKEKIKKDAKSKMAKYKYPREIEFLEELPKDEIGKVQYSELRSRS
jgi:acetyl-CoA synthetase